MFTRLIFAFFLTGLLALSGCRKAANNPAAPDADKELAAALVGQWERQWEMGKGGSRRTLNADGTLVIREYRPAAAGTANVADKLYNRFYKVDLPLFGEPLQGRWSVRDGYVTYAVSLPKGDPLTMKYKVEKVTGGELIESAEGVDGKTQAKYDRIR